MSISPNDLIESAEELHSLGTELTYRAAASRAHYSIYHNVLPVVELCENCDKKVGVHQKNINRLAKGNTQIFNAQDNGLVRSLSYIMSQTRAARVEADYKLHYDFQEDQSALCIQQAKRISERVEGLVRSNEHLDAV